MVVEEHLLYSNKHYNSAFASLPIRGNQQCLYGLIVIVVTFFIAICSLTRITQNLKTLDKWLVLIELMRSIAKTLAKDLANILLALALLI
ncbi:hypothetical protein [Phytobacter sp. V91]|uniref:hypothetical protein n=1 Tax=Phytobacter sp. V91 TaxID=3369425 RepID=UPI003F613295